MRHALLPFVVVLLSSIQPSLAQQTASFGGMVPCQAMTSDSGSAKEAGAWIFGFWSGMNLMAKIKNDPPDVGHTLKPEQVVSAVLDICARNPSMVTLMATFQDWNSARAEGH